MRNFASYVVLGYGSWKVEDIPFFGKLGKGIQNLRTQNIFLIRKAKNSDPSYSLSDSNHLNPNPATRSALPVTFSMSAPGPLLSHHLRSPAIFCQEIKGRNPTHFSDYLQKLIENIDFAGIF